MYMLFIYDKQKYGFQRRLGFGIQLLCVNKLLLYETNLATVLNCCLGKASMIFFLLKTDYTFGLHKKEGNLLPSLYCTAGA
jgi:hypothetical protein